MYEQGSVRFVVAKKGTVKSATELHWHDCFELELVVSGRGTHIINGNSYPMREGDLYLLTKEDCHKVIADETMTILGIMFDERILAESVLVAIPLVRITSPELNVNIGGELYSEIKGYFERVIREEKSEIERYLAPDYIRGLIECIIIELFRSIVGASPSVTSKTSNDALAYMHKHYAEDITLESLAREVHLSPSYLSAYFKNTVGGNFREYLIELRMKHAARLLANTELSVTDVCYSCGFSTYSHFIRSFKARFGEPPLEFRKIHKLKK